MWITRKQLEILTGAMWDEIGDLQAEVRTLNKQMKAQILINKVK